jgi:hypothetical protein
MKYVGCVLMGMGILLFGLILGVPLKIVDDIRIVAPYAHLGVVITMFGFILWSHSLMREEEK